MKTKYTFTTLANEASHEAHLESPEAAVEEARAWAVDQYGRYYYGAPSTVWEDVRVAWIDEDGDECEDIVRDIALHPPVPKCVRGQEHDWQTPYAIVGGIKENPGVWGSGGGVKGVEVCMSCGCGKHWDNWAQRPDNGVQGLTSVRYEAGEFLEQIDHAS